MSTLDSRHEKMPQTMGTPNVTASYHMYTGVFLHFWGVFEWTMAKILYENRNDSRILDRLNFWSDKDKVKNPTLVQAISSGSLEDIKLCTGIDDKLELLNQLSFKIKAELRGPRVLRNIIGHDGLFYLKNIGAYQFPAGWQKEDRKSVYTEEEIKTKVNQLCKIIEKLGLPVSDDKVYQTLKRDNLL